MLTSSAVMSITNDLALSPHDRRSASQPPRRESATSNATRTRPHTVSAETRHTFATAMAEAGVDLAVMQALLGHAHVDTTARYIHLAPTHVRKEIRSARRAPRPRVNRPRRCSLPTSSTCACVAAATPPTPRRRDRSCAAGHTCRIGPTSHSSAVGGEPLDPSVRHVPDGHRPTAGPAMTTSSPANSPACGIS